jgi:OOP family OmpA-OmpF porin
MLTAIRDFVQDSFGAGKEDVLDALRVGERSVWIEQGPRALLAAAIRGNPPPELRTMLSEALDEVHFRQETALDAFDGDPAPFEAVRPVLEGCLQVRLLPSARRRKSAGAWLAAAALLLAAGWGVFRLAEDGRRWSRFMTDLRARPGIVVTAVEEKGGRRHVYGLRDPYAPEPLELLGPAGIRPEAVIFHWEPLQSSHPEYARRRVETVFNPPATARLTFTDGVLKAEGSARRAWIADARRLAKALPWVEVYDEAGLVDIEQRLQPPPTVQLSLDGSSLHATGTAPRRWIAEARAAAPAIPGIAAYRDEELLAAEPRELDQLKRRIESAVFYFEPGRRELAPGQEPAWRDLEQAALRLVALAQELEQDVGLEIVGHSDRSGSKDLNMQISHDRAQHLSDRLASAGIPEGRLKVRAAGSSQPLNPGAAKKDLALNRRVTFEVNVIGS